MSFRLRYLAQDLALPVGKFVIGRAPECELALDDPMVSRRHAELHVKPTQVSVHDLGSRNGVLVDGKRIKGTLALKGGERIVIGSQEMAVYRADEARIGRPEPRIGMATLGSVTVVRTLGSLMLDDEGVPPEPTMAAMPGQSDAEGRVLQTITLLGGVADKALALGRTEDAERVLAAVLADVAQRANARAPVGAALAEVAALRAAKLAAATGRGVWVDYVVQLYSALDLLAPAAVVDELHATIRKVKAVDLPLIREYVAAMKQNPKLGPTDRFVVQRLEGVAQLAALK